MTEAPLSVIFLVMVEGAGDTGARNSPGEPPPAEQLLLRYLPSLRGFVRLKSGARLRALESCSDLVQSICREILQHWERYQGDDEAAFRAWLFKTAERKIRTIIPWVRPVLSLERNGDDGPLTHLRGIQVTLVVLLVLGRNPQMQTIAYPPRG